MESRRRFGAGSFGSSSKMIGRRKKTSRQRRPSLSPVVWRALLRSTGLVLLIGLSLIAGLFGILVLTAFLAASALASAAQSPHAGTIRFKCDGLNGWLTLLIAIALAAQSSRLAAFFGFIFLTCFWTTTLEKDVDYRKRREILKAAEETLSHVLADLDASA
jgi:hypothetical protein